MVRDPMRSGRINVKLSKIRFPEICPVCLSEPEDLVFVTVIEKKTDDYASSSWTRQDKTDIALQASSDAVTFAIPTCLRHGSKSIRTLRTKLIAVLGLFILFYPILFYLLRINVALVYSRSLVEPLIGFITFTAILVLILLYGLFPRALERAIRFHEVDRVKDTVVISMSNGEYRDHFLEINEMQIIESSKDTSSGAERTGD